MRSVDSLEPVVATDQTIYQRNILSKIVLATQYYAINLFGNSIASAEYS